MMKINVKALQIVAAGIITAIVAGPVSALEQQFTDDFSSWTLVSWSDPAGYEPGDWPAATHTRSL